MDEKHKLREHYKKIRRHLPNERRVEAREMLWEYLQGQLVGKVLSFASMKDEVDLSQVNRILLEQGRLYLPKIEGDHLVAYKVQNLEQDTFIVKPGILQPNPELCEREEAMDSILVPAIAFDERLHRLGYGFGFYDRLLSQNKNKHSIGIGFREQLSKTPLPTEEHDQPVNELCLV